MKPPCRVLFLLGASLTEVRCLLPVLRELEPEDGIRTSSLVVRHEDSRLAATLQFLNEQGIRYRTTGIDAPVSAEHILKEYTPDVIVMANDCGIVNRFVVQESVRVGVPTVLVQEAGPVTFYSVIPAVRSVRWLLHHIDTAMFLTRVYLANGAISDLWNAAVKTIQRKPIGSRGYGFRNVSLYCVLSEFEVQNYQKYGSEAKRIIATGIPGLIESGEPFDASRSHDYDFVIFTNAEYHFLMTEEEELGLYRDVVETIRHVKPGAKIGVKLHPLEAQSKLKALTGVDFLDTLDTAFDRGKVMVGTMTTVILQSLLKGFPTVMYQPSSYQWPINSLTDSCRALRILATNTEELSALIERGLNGLEREPDVVSFGQVWNMRLRESATTIKNLILELCGLNPIDLHPHSLRRSL